MVMVARRPQDKRRSRRWYAELVAVILGIGLLFAGAWMLNVGVSLRPNLQSVRSSTPSLQFAGYAVVALVAAIGIIAAWVALTSITASRRNQTQLRAMLFVLRLVQQFVQNRGRWPKSWEELEQMPFPLAASNSLRKGTPSIQAGRTSDDDWPNQSKALQERVTIDFDADPTAIVSQDPQEFTAIRSTDPHAIFRGFGFVESLQAALKTATGMSAQA
jgi:hypothetical protein